MDYSICSFLSTFFIYRMAHLIDTPWVGITGRERGTPYEEWLYSIPEASLPELIKCKIFKSECMYRDRCFFAAFMYQNRTWFTPDQFLRALRFCNISASEARLEQIRGVFLWFEDAERRLADGHETMRLCQYFAYDCTARRVLDLRGHVRHFNLMDDVGGARVHWADPCSRYFGEYHRLCDVNIIDILGEMPPLFNPRDGDSDSCLSDTISTVSYQSSLASRVSDDFEDADVRLPIEEVEEAILWLADNAEEFLAGEVLFPEYLGVAD